MYAICLFLFIQLTQVQVAVGPEMAAEARPVEAAIDEVTVFSDRARVRRKGRVTIPSGATAVRLPDLPGGTMRPTVRLRCDGAEVARVEMSNIALERISIDQVDALLEKLEAATDRVALLDARMGVIDRGIALVRGVSPRAPVAEGQRIGKAKLSAEGGTWRKVMDFLDARQASLLSEKVTLEAERKQETEALMVLRREVGRYDLGGISDRKLRVVALLDARQKRQVTIELEDFVPGAYWRPNYDLHFDPNESRIDLKAAGMVTQASGEPWDDVRLVLSTASPGWGLTPPELLTWTLGEKSEYLPRASETNRRPAVPRNPPPVAKQIAAEQEAAARREVLASRLRLLKAMAAGATFRPRPKAKRREKLRKRRADSSGSAGRPTATAYEFEEDMIAAEMVAPAPPPSAMRASRRSKVSQAKPRPRAGRAMDLFAGDGPKRPMVGDPTLPALLSGGLDYEFIVPQRMTVPSDGRALRAPFESRRYAVSTFYEATPALEKVAYLKAEVKNDSKLPILGGPANIFVGGRFTSQAQLDTTGAGGALALPLGADEDIRLIRTLVPKSRTEGIFSKEDITEYTVTLEVGNYKRRPVRIRVNDQVPKSRHEKVVVEGVKIPKPAQGPNGVGLVHWERTIAPGETEKLVFSYSIRRPKNWRVSQ